MSSLRRTVNDMRPLIDELYSMANRGRSGIAALQNRAYANNPGTNPADPTAGSPATVLLGKLTVHGSGIFLVSVNMSATGLTATDTVDTSITTGTAAAITLANNTSVGVGTAPPAAGGAANGVYVSSAAAGMTVTGPGIDVPQFDSGPQVQGTGDTTWQFAWSGIVQNGNPTGGLAPFPKGADVVVQAVVNRSAAAMTFTSVSLSFLELP